MSVGQASAIPILNMSTDQNELLKVLESSIRQKVETEIRATLQAEAASPENQSQMFQKIKEDFEQEEENRRLAVRMALIAEGDKIIPVGHGLAASKAKRRWRGAVERGQAAFAGAFGRDRPTDPILTHSERKRK